MSWGSVLKRNDAIILRQLHLVVGSFLMIFFMIGSKFSTKQLFILATLTLVLIIISAEFTIRIPSLRDGKKVVSVLKTYEIIDDLLYRLDLERNEVLLLKLNGENNASMRDKLQRAFDSIITQIVPSILEELRIKHKFNVSLLIPNQDGKFKVRSSFKVTPEHKTLMEEKFRWKDPIVGLAGYCISTKEKVDVVDFSNPEFSTLRNYWVSLDENEKPHDSFYANPIIYGNPEDESSIAVAVLCVTVRGKNAWNSENINNMMVKVSESIETLLYIEDILQIEDYDIILSHQEDNPI